MRIFIEEYADTKKQPTIIYNVSGLTIKGGKLIIENSRRLTHVVGICDIKSLSSDYGVSPPLKPTWF